MRRRLLIINLALAAAVAIGFWQFRKDYQAAVERYTALQPAARGTVAPPAAAALAPAPVQPGHYLEAAEKYLFSPDRNPTVVVEPPKAKPKPEMPRLYGVMNIGGGPIAIMSVGQGPHKSVRLGESIGDFKLLAAAREIITLEWDGEKIEAPVSDLLVRPSAQGGASAGGAAGAAPAPATGAPAGAAVLNPSAASGRPGEYLIGAPMQGSQGTIYQSPPGDTAPHGTVYQGKRKVVRNTPFGQQAWWEDVKP